ncbi:unnamed protein product [Durusdinium trenchii]|uniref:Chaperone protein DnaJ n=2 Tax=Durusdinium trenchii TaxID=1381693 RepID=A0ABP0LZR3_9DINO
MMIRGFRCGLVLVFAFSASAGSHPRQQAMTVDSSGDLEPSKLMRSHGESGDSHGVSILEEHSDILPSAADLAYKAMDLGFGTTGMALDDYPFACICDAEGKCAADPVETGCKMRAGMPNNAKSCSLCLWLWLSSFLWLR